MDDFDNLLNSIGITTNRQPPATGADSQNQPETSIVSAPAVHASTAGLTEQDADDIFQELGFMQETEAEEIVEDNMAETVEAFEEENTDIEFQEISYQESHEEQEETQNIEGEIERLMDTPEYQQEMQERMNNLMEEYSQSNVQAQTEEHPLIVPNSTTLTMNEATTRFSGAAWYGEIQRQRVIVAGVGGIGSNLAFQLARMNLEALALYDDDYVENVNMAGQLFSKQDVGKTKVDAMASMISDYTTMTHAYAIREKFTSESMPGYIMMCGFDNMAARRQFFQTWKQFVSQLPEQERRKCLFLDGRLSIDVAQVFCITGDCPEYMRIYEDKYLFLDSEADDTMCSLKQTTYMACLIASLMVNHFTNFVANLLDPLIPYDLPFFTEYDARNMIFNKRK